MNFSKPVTVLGLSLAAGLLLITPVVIHAAASQPTTTNSASPGEDSTSSTTSPTADDLAVVLVDQPGNPGATDTVPPVIPGGVGSWEEIFSKMGGNAQYWNCFTSTTGHSKAEAEAALAAERRGDNVKLTLYSNVDAASWSSTTDTKGLNLDPDVKEVGNLDNTRGADDGGCGHFEDDRSQVRIALTLPGPNADTPGEPIILAHCGNPLGKPQPKPAVPRKLKPAPNPKPAPAQPGTTSPPKTVPSTQPPGTTPPPAPPTTLKCAKAGKDGICGTPDDEGDFLAPQAPPPSGVNIGPTPGYVPPATPIAGHPGTGAGGTTPSQDGGTNVPVTAPVGGQTNNGSSGGPPP